MSQTAPNHPPRLTAQRVTCTDPTEDRYVDLVIAIFRRAKSDLRHPGYCQGAQQWLRSRHAAFYANLLCASVDPTELTEGRHV